MKLLFITIIIFTDLAFAQSKKPNYDQSIRVRVAAEYDKFENIDQSLKNYLIVNSEKEDSQWAKKKHLYAKKVKEFKDWTKEKKYEYLFTDDRIAVIQMLVIDELAGYDIRLQPMIFLKIGEQWTVPDEEIRQVYVLDLDGDKRKDILYTNNCCGSETMGAYLNRGESTPLAVSTIFWRRMAAPVPEKAESNIKLCKGQDRRYWPSYDPIKKTYATCEKFRIEFKVRHCDLQSETFLSFDCSKMKFYFKQEPFE